ncbi:MAG: cytochrome b/b6 domain-containing protein [Candidatus Thiodiazotropha sp.]
MTKRMSYGKFDKFIHWLMAVNIGATLYFAYGISELTNDLKLAEYGDHGLSVTTIAICLVIRTLWRAYEGFPALPASMSQIQKLAAKAMHYFLYICLCCQIVVGILLASTTEQDFIATGYNIDYSSFNLVSKELYQPLLLIHKSVYWLILALLAIHITAAFKHHFFDKDEVLIRMLPFMKRR